MQPRNQDVPDLGAPEDSHIVARHIGIIGPLGRQLLDTLLRQTDSSRDDLQALFTLLDIQLVPPFAVEARLLHWSEAVIGRQPAAIDQQVGEQPQNDEERDIDDAGSGRRRVRGPLGAFLVIEIGAGLGESCLVGLAIHEYASTSSRANAAITVILTLNLILRKARAQRYGKFQHFLWRMPWHRSRQRSAPA